MALRTKISGGPAFQAVGWDISQSGPRAAVIENCVPVVLFWELVGSAASVLVHIPELPMFLLVLHKLIVGFLSKELNILWEGVQPTRCGSSKDTDVMWVRGKASNLHGTLGRCEFWSSGKLNCHFQNLIRPTGC